MEVLKEKKRQLETSDTKPKLVGHVQLDEKGELLKIEAEPEDTDKVTEGGGAPKHQVTQSITTIRDTRRKENIQKQERRWFALTGRKSTASASLGAPTEATATMTETDAASSVGEEGTTLTAVTSTTEGDTVDLEEAMLSQGDDNDDVYGKKYRTTPEDRTDRSAARAKHKEDREKQEKEHVALRYAEAQLQKEVEERQKQEAQKALLEEEEKAVEERRKLSEEKQKARLERKGTELQKQKQHEKECLEKHQKKSKEKEEEEEEAMIDNTNKDKDYNPDDDPEADFVEEDQEIEDEDMFEVEKHVHTLNFEEAGDYLMSMNWYMEAFSKIVRRGKEDVPREYKKLIKFVKLMIEKLEAYSPIEATDMEAVFETVVDPQCVAWRRAQHGMKTGNSKEILRVEEKCWKVERSIEEREISPEEQVKTFADMMTVKSKTERADMIHMIKCYFGHVAKAHEEAASAVRIAQELVDEVDENSWLQIVSNGTRPLVMLKVPEMMQQVAMMKSDRERREKAEQLRGRPIEEIIKEQNMPRPVEHWVDSKIMSPSAYLAVAVFYFLYGVVDQKKAVANQMVAELFQISKSNLHQITSGRKYAGGSVTTGRKLKSVQELEEHGERMVTISKVKTKSKLKSQKKVTVMKTTPKVIPLPFLMEQAGESEPRRSRWRKDMDKKDDDKEPMVH